MAPLPPHRIFSVLVRGGGRRGRELAALSSLGKSPSISNFAMARGGGGGEGGVGGEIKLAFLPSPA